VLKGFFQLWMACYAGVACFYFPNEFLLWLATFLGLACSRRRLRFGLFFSLGCLSAALEYSTDLDRAKQRQSFVKSYETFGSFSLERRKLDQEPGAKWDWNKYKDKGIVEKLFAALFKGEQSALPSKYWDLFSYLGVVHLFVVSGLHIGIIVWISSFLIKSILARVRITGKKRLYNLILLVELIALVSFFNFQLPILRASLGFFLYVLLADRIPQLHRYPKTELLSGIGLLLLLLDPVEALERSYIFSFSATLILLRAVDLKMKLNYWSVQLLPGLVIGLLTHLFAEPMSFLSPLVNLLFVPLFFFLLLPAIVVGRFVSSWRSEIEGVLQSLFFSLESVAEEIANLSPAESLSTFWIFCLIAGLIYSMCAKLQRRLSCLVILYFIFALISLLPTWMPATEVLKIRSVDVGLGDAFIVECGGSRIAIDGGETKNFGRRLYKEAAMKVDAWILTHFDRDHIQYFERFSKKVDFSELWIARLDQSRFSRKLLNDYKDKLRIASKMPEPLKLCNDHCCFEASWLDRKKRLPRGSVENRDSLVMTIYERGTDWPRALFLGDLDAAREKTLVKSYKQKFGPRAPQRLEFMKIAHHGSTTSSSKELLRYFRPRVVAIPAGRNNRFNFPRPSVLDRLKLWGCTIFRTDAIGEFALILGF
jgi:competence protein ComEC